MNDPIYTGKGARKYGTLRIRNAINEKEKIEETQMGVHLYVCMYVCMYVYNKAIKKCVHVCL